MIRCEELGVDNLKIMQDCDLFCFGTDSVALSKFARAKKGDRVVDLCTGNGIIPVLMSAYTKAEDFWGVEIQEPSYELAVKNAEINCLSGKVHFIKDDIKNVLNHFKNGSVDVVTCNPPYMSVTAGFKNEADTLKIARHEILIDLDGVVKSASEILKFGGNFFMVHRAERLCDVICTLRKYTLEPKRIRFLAPSSEKAPNLLLIEAKKGASPSLKFEPTEFVNV